MEAMRERKAHRTECRAAEVRRGVMAARSIAMWKAHECPNVGAMFVQLRIAIKSFPGL